MLGLNKMDITVFASTPLIYSFITQGEPPNETQTSYVTQGGRNSRPTFAQQAHQRKGKFLNDVLALLLLSILFLGVLENMFLSSNR